MKRGNLTTPRANPQPSPVVFEPPQRITNSSSKHPYTPPKWPTRAGADQHLAFRSLTS